MERPVSALRRKSQVFVEIPPSPLLSSKSSGAHPRVHQESTPLKTVAMNVDPPEASTSSPTSNKLKRKSMDASHVDSEGKAGLHAPKSKKLKSEAQAKPDATSLAKDGKAGGNGDASSSQETVRCHQCTRPYNPSVVVHCTAIRPSGQRCVFKYCKACMRNRYQEDTENIMSRTAADVQPEERRKHVNGTQYLFRCPRCRDTCNCRGCRKAKGLPATGDLNLLARKAARVSNAQEVSGLASGEDAVVAAPTTTSKQIPPGSAPISKPVVTAKRKSKAVAKKAAPSLPKPHATKGKPHVLIPPSPRLAKLKNGGSNDAIQKSNVRAGRPKREPAPRAIPRPMWTSLPTRLTYDGALQRLDIREFLLRFAHLIDIARGHLEELEELGSTSLGPCLIDDSQGPEAPELVGWVSEVALKAILVGLLTVISKDLDSEDKVSALSAAIHAVKASGASLNKMWAALAPLQESGVLPLALPAPLPPAESMSRHSTRSGKLAQDSSSASVVVTSTAQLVPIVNTLVECALYTKAIRDDFERAVAQEKDLARAARELTAEQVARRKALWTAKDATKESRQVARDTAKAAIAAIEHAHKIASAECIPRFAPLGRDTEGRVYYALTPGIIEREAALDLLEGGKGEVKLGKRRGVADEPQRKRMRHWSWFLAVWGRKPEGADVAKLDSGDEGDNDAEGEEDANEERWWAFWQPEEVAKLSEWLAMKYGINLEAKRQEPEDGVSLHDEGEHTPQQEVEGKRQIRPSNASSVTDTSFSGPSRRGARTFASLNRDSSDEEDEAGDGSDYEGGNVQMRVDARGEPLPSRQDLQALARGLKEYAELLDWRIKRASKEAKEGAEKIEKGDKGTSVDPNGKGKGVEKAAIPTQTFYGK